MVNEIQILRDEKETNTQNVQNLSSELTRLNELQTQLEQDGWELQNTIQGFLAPPVENEIMNYIYGYANSLNQTDERMVIRDLIIPEGTQSDLGFSQVNITISAIVSSEKALFDFLDFLTNPEWEYKMYIQNFEYPMNDTTGNLQVSIPLVLYYNN